MSTNQVVKRTLNLTEICWFV